ncbi:unnamed protein product [Ectocarpus sp. 8 AP-2014]
MPRSVVFRRRRLYCFFLSSALFYSKFSIRALVLKTSTKNGPTLDQTSNVRDPDSYNPNLDGAFLATPHNLVTTELANMPQERIRHRSARPGLHGHPQRQRIPQPDFGMLHDQRTLPPAKDAAAILYKNN